jgi:hypothetical protein
MQSVCFPRLVRPLSPPQVPTLEASNSCEPRLQVNLLCQLKWFLTTEQKYYCHASMLCAL